jgi:hypothetical protein
MWIITILTDNKLWKRAFVIFITLLFSVASLPLVTNFASAQSVEIVTIKADGSIEPANVPIQQNGDVYTITDNIQQYLVLERNYTTLDGGGHHVSGVYGPLIDWESYPWVANGTTNMTVTNVVIDHNMVFFSTVNSVFSNITLNNGTGIEIDGDGNIIANTTVNYGRGLAVDGKNNVVSGNHLNYCNFTYSENNPPPFGIAVGGSNNIVIGNYIIGTNGSAINLGTSSDNIIFGNQIENNQVGIRTMSIYPILNAENNTVYNNNFVNNIQIHYNEMVMVAPDSVTIWDYNTLGNYWSNYNGSDVNGDGKGDSPYIIDANNQDNYPLMNPVDITSISSLPIPSPTPSPTPTVTPTQAPTTNPTTNPTQPTNTPAPTALLSPSPVIPEFPLLTILPFLITIFSAAVIMKKSRPTKKAKFLAF